jgi:hypothetical protein
MLDDSRADQTRTAEDENFHGRGDIRKSPDEQHPPI